MSLATQGGSNVAVTGKTVQSVSGEVTDGKLKITVNGVSSGDIPLPESTPLRGYIQNVYKSAAGNISLFSPNSKNVVKYWMFDPYGSGVTATKYSGTLNYRMIPAMTAGDPELVTEHGITYYKYPDYDGDEPSISQITTDVSNSSKPYFAASGIASRSGNFLPYMIYINGKKSYTIRFKCKYTTNAISPILWSISKPGNYVYLSISLPLSDRPLTKDLCYSASISQLFYSADFDSSKLILYPVGVEVI